MPIFLLAFLACSDSGEDTGTNDTDVAENRAPVAVDDAAATFGGSQVEIDVLDNDNDPDGDGLDIIAVTQGQNGFVEIDGSYVLYTPTNESFVGVDSFTYTIDDGNGHTDEASIAVNVKEQPTLVIISPEDGATVTGPDVTITFEVNGCTVTSPSDDAAECHVHKWLDGERWTLEDGTGHGAYYEGTTDITGVAAGEHTFTLKLAVNDGSDALWSPAIEDSVTLTITEP